jgi:peroxiredoxin
MTIAVGDKLPHATVLIVGPDGRRETTTDHLFAGKTVVLFGVPGAFTPTCSGQHLPGYLANARAFRDKGVSDVVCLSVNDPFVMEAWAKDQNAGEKVLFLADGSGEYINALGLEMDLSAKGLGIRSQRFALIAQDRTVIHLAIDRPGDFSFSKAERILEALP